MNWVLKIQEAINYIESNLLDEINVDMVGKAINYAPSSFQQLFSAITGYSISEYIRLRRLSGAANELLNEDCQVTEIAFKYGYNTVEAFSKAYKRFQGYSPSKTNLIHKKFDPIQIEFNILGGFYMAKNFIPNLTRVDWSDGSRQNEFVWSVISVLGAFDEKLDYDYVCAISGCAFRTSFSYVGWNHGNYHVINAPCIIDHTFKMLGYKVTHHTKGDYDADKKLITDSIDKGIPVITLEGVINCSDACIISGYDNDGDVLLGYSPFMYISDDHNEPHDETGYFRKSGWHKSENLIIITIDEKCDKPSADEIFEETLKSAVYLIKSETIVNSQHNGITAHKAFANALLTYDWDDNFEPYLNVMCNFKQYQDKQYAVKYLIDNGRKDLAVYYENITGLKNSLAIIIPQDFTAFDLFGDKEKLKPFSEILLQMADLEDEFALKI